MNERWHVIREAWEGWRPAILMALAALLIVGGWRFEGFGRAEAFAAGFAFPVVVMLASAIALREHRRRLVIASAIVALAAAGAGEEQVSEVLVPPDPIGRVELDTGASASIDVPNKVHHLRLAAHGDLGNKSGMASYVLDLDREGGHEEIKGTFKKKVRRGRNRLGVPTRSISLRLTDRHDLDLAGSGPVKLTLAKADDLLAPPIQVTLSPAPGAETPVRIALVALLLAAAVCEAFSSRRGARVRLTIGVAMTIAFSEMMSGAYNPDKPLTFVLAATLVALIGGGIAGWAVGGVATAIGGRKAGEAEA